MSETGCVRRPLTKLLSSFLMVDLPHRALTPSTATARRKVDPGCPLCSLSSFITAPTTSVLLFIRLMPYNKGGKRGWLHGSGLSALNLPLQITRLFNANISCYQCFPFNLQRKVKCSPHAVKLYNHQITPLCGKREEQTKKEGETVPNIKELSRFLFSKTNFNSFLGLPKSAGCLIIVQWVYWRCTNNRN